jgi:hypothetical protein
MKSLTVVFLSLIFTLYTLHGQVLDRVPLEFYSHDYDPENNEVDYSPQDNDVTATNPPAFIWLPVKEIALYILQFSRDRNFSPEQTTEVNNLDITVHIPTEVMDTGTWYWRYGYTGANGKIFSRIRRFVIPESAINFPLIPVDEFLSRIPKHRPRLYFSPDLVNQIRSDTEGHYSDYTSNIIGQAKKVLEIQESLFPEPDPWPEDYMSIYEQTWRAMRPYTQRMVTCALAYLYTGDVRFGEEAKRRLLHFMAWDVDGPSSSIWPTELGMDIAENTVPVFDWIYDLLDDEEKELCKETLIARMMQINRDVHRSRPMETRPFSSHPGRMVGFAIEGGIVLAHETPEVRDWIDYTIKLLWSTYPCWGGPEGGWHEGVHYWSAYMNKIIRVVHELDLYGIPLKDKPFFRNTGYFGLYAGYIDRPTAAFGDGHHIPPGASVGNVNYILSKLYNNPYLRWHSNQIVSNRSGREALRTHSPGLESLSPDDLPQSRLFNDVGLVAMHSNMADPENNVMMLFQSNPFGAISHNHASQNAFVIEAFKEPLAISSGYRQVHGVPHHRQWVWQTKAHNSILVDNEGQVPRRRISNGRIFEYREQDDYLYTAGDATRAYGGRLEKFHRHIIFVRPDYFVIIDDLETSGTLSTYQWLLHAKNEMQVEPEYNTVISTSGNARLSLRFLAPDKLEFKQHTGFDPPVEIPETAPDQFHLSASTINASNKQIFISVLRVDQIQPVKFDTIDKDKEHGADSDLENLQIRIIGNKGIIDHDLLNKSINETELINARGGIAIRVGSDLILFKDGSAKKIRAAGTSTKEPAEVKINYFR